MTSFSLTNFSVFIHRTINQKIDGWMKLEKKSRSDSALEHISKFYRADSYGITKADSELSF